jgi:hypothetical protein
MTNKRTYYVNKDENSGDLRKYTLHTLKTRPITTNDYEGYTYSYSLVIPKMFRKNPKAFLKKHYEFHERCHHEHDCCGCVFMAYIEKFRKLNRRNWNIHVHYCRNL